MMRGKCFFFAVIAATIVGLSTQNAFAHRGRPKPAPKPNPFALTQDQRAQLRTALPTLGSAWWDFWKTAQTTLTAAEFKTLTDAVRAQLATLKTATDWPSFFSVWDSVYAQIEATVTAKADATLSAKYTTLKAAYDAVKLIIVPAPPAVTPPPPAV